MRIRRRESQRQDGKTTCSACEILFYVVINCCSSSLSDCEWTLISHTLTRTHSLARSIAHSFVLFHHLRIHIVMVIVYYLFQYRSGKSRSYCISKKKKKKKRKTNEERNRSACMYVRCAMLCEFVLCAHAEQAAYFHFVIKIQSKFRTLSM